MNQKFVFIIIFAGYTGLLFAANEMKIADKVPVPITTTTGFMQEITEVRENKGPPRTGKQIFEFRCNGCHGRNTQGAPMPDDRFEWSMRLKKKGLAMLLKHSIEGYSNTLMPPKGGCRDCSKEEVYAAVYYMLDRSGIKFKKLK